MCACGNSLVTIKLRVKIANFDLLANDNSSRELPVSPAGKQILICHDFATVRAPDWEITGALTLNLRAERAGGGSGRVYTITVESRDRADNSSTRTVEVRVPQ